MSLFYVVAKENKTRRAFYNIKEGRSAYKKPPLELSEGLFWF